MNLEPAIVWRHFETLCGIPRPSKHEAGVREHLIRWAQRLHLAAEVDAAGNLLLRKAATAGHEQAPGIALQAHLDMVCQANVSPGGEPFDFLRTPITPCERDGWLMAENTTLGADNGIGVALALAALEDEHLLHGPLEVLLTVDEEAGMGGAHGLASGWLKSRLMLNLDTEEWGEFYLGCAGGCDVNVERSCATRPLRPGESLWRLAVGGLKGGHSGVDIHRGLGNANRILGRVLRELESGLVGGLHLVSFEGGTARNALTREANAVFACDSVEAGALIQRVEALQASERARLSGVDDGLACSLSRVESHPARGSDGSSQVLEQPDQDALLAALCEAPYGVCRMSDVFAGVVDTSNNLGIVRLRDGEFSANLMVRSLRDEATRALARDIETIFIGAGCKVRIDGDYPGWTPNPDSPLLALCQQAYRETFGAESRVQVIHAGLECGIIGAKYPGLDVVSFGPTIRGAHAPGEKVEIASVERTWVLLRALLTKLATGR